MGLARHRRFLRASALVISVSGLASMITCDRQNDGAISGVSCSASVPGVTPTEIKAGLILNDTGPQSAAMDAFRAGIEARLKAANGDNGGVYGREVTYVWQDDQADPKLNLIAADKLVTDEKVFGIIEEPIAAVGSVESLSEQGIPVTGLAFSPNWLGKKNMFSWSYSGGGSVTTWGEYMRGSGVSRVALLAVSGDRSSENLMRQMAASLQATNIRIIKTFQVAEATTSYQQMAQQIKAANIDAIAGVLLPTAAAQLLPELRKVGVILGVNLKVILMALGYDASSLNEDGQALAGASILVPIKPFEVGTPGQGKFLDSMNKYSPEIQPPTQDSAVYGWLSADLFLRGLQAAGECPTRSSFIANLRAVKDYDGAGMTLNDHIDLSANFREVSTCYSLVQISPDGKKFVPQNGGQPYCGTAISPEQTDQYYQGY